MDAVTVTTNNSPISDEEIGVLVQGQLSAPDNAANQNSQNNQDANQHFQKNITRE